MFFETITFIALIHAAIARPPGDFDVKCRSMLQPAPYNPPLHACYLVNKNEVEFDAMYNNKKYHNHLDYYLFALVNEGANSSRLDSAYEEQALEMDPAVPSQSRVTEDTYNSSLGQYYVDPNDSWYLDFVEFFRNQSKLHNGSSEALLWTYLPQLIPSVGCMLIHPFIQLGYAWELTGGDSRLVIEGLAWLSTGFDPDPIPLNESASWSSAFDALTALYNATELPNSTVQYDDVPLLYGPIISQYDLMLPPCHRADFDESLRSMVSQVSEVVLRIFAATGYQGFNELHLVTGCRALRKLIANLPDPVSRRRTMLYFWRVVMYTYTSLGRPAVPARIPSVDPSSLPGWTELLEQGMPMTDTHFHKMLWLCKDEVSLLSEEDQDTELALLYHITAARIVTNFTEGGDWVH